MPPVTTTTLPAATAPVPVRRRFPVAAAAPAPATEPDSPGTGNGLDNPGLADLEGSESTDVEDSIDVGTEGADAGADTSEPDPIPHPRRGRPPRDVAAAPAARTTTRAKTSTEHDTKALGELLVLSKRENLSLDALVHRLRGMVAAYDGLHQG